MTEQDYRTIKEKLYQGDVAVIVQTVEEGKRWMLDFIENLSTVGGGSWSFSADLTKIERFAAVGPPDRLMVVPERRLDIPADQDLRGEPSLSLWVFVNVDRLTGSLVQEAVRLSNAMGADHLLVDF